MQVEKLRWETHGRPLWASVGFITMLFCECASLFRGCDQSVPTYGMRSTQRTSGRFA